MNALTVILIIISVLLIISLIKIEIIVQFKNKLKLVIKVLFFKKTIVKKFDEEEMPKKQPEKPKKPKKEKKPEDTSAPPRQSLIQRFFRQQGISGLIEIIKQLLALVKGTLRYFFKHFIVQKLIVKITVASGDASQTAINYGRISAVIYPLTGHLAYALNCEEYKVDVLCNFDENAESEAYLYMYGSIRIVYLIIMAVKAAARAGKTYLKLKFRQ